MAVLHERPGWRGTQAVLAGDPADGCAGLARALRGDDLAAFTRLPRSLRARTLLDGRGDRVERVASRRTDARTHGAALRRTCIPARRVAAVHPHALFLRPRNQGARQAGVGAPD